MIIKKNILIAMCGITSLLGAYSLLAIRMDTNNIKDEAIFIIKEEAIFIIFELLTAFGIISLSVVFFNWVKEQI